MWTDKAQTKAIDFHLDVSNCPEWIVEDGSRLQQILFNLLSNAVKFTDSGSVSLTVETVASAEGELLMLMVSDTGIGIADDQFERIFESFTQVDGAMSRQFGGTGLGLTIVRNLAHALGGRIDVSSKLGDGSTFTLELPLVRCAKTATVSDGPAQDLKTTYLLVIEDNPLAQSMLRATMQKQVRKLEFAKSVELVADPSLRALIGSSSTAPACRGNIQRTPWRPSASWRS